MKVKANLSRTLLMLPVVVVAVGVVLFGVVIKTAEPQTTPSYYKVQDLGSLPESGVQPPNSVPHGVNDFGHVVGVTTYMVCPWGSYYCGWSVHAFLYKDGRMMDLGTLAEPDGDANSDSSASDINDLGQVVGYSQTVCCSWNYAGEQHAFLYENGQMKDLGTLGGTNSYAYAINNSGQVVGDSDTASGQRHAFLYDNGQMKDLNSLIPQDSGWTLKNASGINTAGQIVGEGLINGQSHAFLYENGQVKDLGTLGGSKSWASGINDSGRVVGTSYNANGKQRAFLWTDDGDPNTADMKALGTLGVPESESVALDINNAGQVVGWSYGTAFLYENGEMIGLKSRLHPENKGNFWNLRSPGGINNKGQIAVDGSFYDGCKSEWDRALLLNPTSDIPPDGESQAPSAPTITSPQNNSYDSVGSFSVSGTAPAGSSVELFEGTTLRGTTNANCSSGAWSIALSGISEGAHTYTAKAKDAAGNTSSASNSVTVTVEKDDPLVSEVYPVDGATGVSRQTDIAARFSEQIDPATLTTSTVMLVKDGTTTPISIRMGLLESYPVKLWISPWSDDGPVTLDANTKYTVKIKGGTNGVKDLEGNQLFNGNQASGDYWWSFTTGNVPAVDDTIAPKVNSVFPKENATGVDPTTNVTATFSEDMLASSINGQTFKLFKKGSTTKLAASVSYNSTNHTAMLDLSNSLRSGATYKAVVTTGAKDLAGNSLAQQKSWFFKVR